MKQETQILECEKRLLEAIKNSDIKELDELLHDELIFNIPNGQTINKVMDIENYKSGIMSVSEIIVLNQNIKCNTKNATVITTIYLKAKYGKQLVEGKFRYCRVWIPTVNSWKVIEGNAVQI